MFLNTVLPIATVWATSFFSISAMAIELSAGDTVAVQWICVDRETIDKIREVAIQADRDAFKTAVSEYANGNEFARCMIFNGPTKVKLVERQFTFTDMNPAYYVEAWSARYGAFNGYTFFGQAIESDSSL